MLTECPLDIRRRHSPVLDAIERLLICDVVHQDEAHGAAVVGRRDGPIPLLARRILEKVTRDCTDQVRCPGKSDSSVHRSGQVSWNRSLVSAQVRSGVLKKVTCQCTGQVRCPRKSGSSVYRSGATTVSWGQRSQCKGIGGNMAWTPL